MRTINPRWMLFAAFLLAAPLMATDRSGVLLTDEKAGATKETKEIKKEQDDIMKRLVSGNKAHMQNLNRKHGIPHIMVVSCADSRVPPEIVFHMQAGELYTVRAYGNIVDQDILASLEYGVEHLNARVIVVLGHTDCTALKDAIDEHQHPRTEWRSLNQKALYEKLEPAVAEVEHSQKISEARNGNHLEGGAFWDAVVRTNILSTMHVIREQSPTIWQAENNDTIKIVGCIYHLENGKIEWIKE